MNYLKAKILKLKAEGRTQSSIAREMGVSRQRISQIVIGSRGSKGRTKIRATLMDAVIKKCGGKCRDCNGKEYLEVHHLDKDPSNNDLDNLIILCHWCHRDRHKSL